MGDRIRFPISNALARRRFIGCTNRSAVIVLMILAGCSKRSIEWTEDVQFQNGSVLQVKQKRELQNVGEIASQHWIATRTTLAIQNSDIKTVWSGEWLVPLVLDRDPSTHELLLVVTTNNDSIWRDLGSPRPPYWQFRWKGSAWTRESVSDFMWEHPSNILQSGLEKKPKEIVSLQQKKVLDSSPYMFRNYTAIHRDAWLGDSRMRGD